MKTILTQKSRTEKKSQKIWEAFYEYQPEMSNKQIIVD